eukprot:1055037-Pyramimonas_sp.AAC.1
MTKQTTTSTPKQKMPSAKHPRSPSGTASLMRRAKLVGNDIGGGGVTQARGDSGEAGEHAIGGGAAE